MIFPYTHEDTVSRRWPVVTTAFVAVCVLVHVGMTFWVDHYERRVAERIAEVESYARAHLGARPCNLDLADIVENGPKVTYEAAPRESSSAEPAGDEAPSLDTAALAGLLGQGEGGDAAPVQAADPVEEAERCSAARVEVETSPWLVVGYVPKRGNPLGLFTSMWIHGGIVHLLSNMWFLWLCACNLEDRWGRLVFVPFYLAGGIVAALTHHALAQESALPLIGASGAVAAAMGAFLLAFAKTKIRFIYAFFWKFGHFSAPAYVMLPLWVLGELFNALFVPASMSGVAHWAHVGGFGFGLVVAFALRVSGTEARLDAAVEQSVTVVGDQRVVRAGELIDAGDTPKAILLLDGVLAKDPQNLDANLELLRAAKVAKERLVEARQYGRLVQLYFDGGYTQTGAELTAEALELGVDVHLPNRCLVRAADEFARSGNKRRALTVYSALLRGGIVDGVSCFAALECAALSIDLGKLDDARTLLEGVLSSPHASPESASRAESLIRRTVPAAVDL